MNEDLLLIGGVIALAPFYTMGVMCTGYVLSFLAHMLRRVDESTKKTELTETITDKNGTPVVTKG